MKCNYLGEFWVEYASSAEGYSTYIVNDEDIEGYSLELFMRVDDSTFDGIMPETNTSAIGLKFSKEGFRLWRVY